MSYYRIKESVKFAWGTNWEIFGTAKLYGPSVQRMVDGGLVSLVRLFSDISVRSSIKGFRTVSV